MLANVLGELLEHRMKSSKLEKLRRILKKLQRVAIAYSGGLDSTFLLKVAVDELGKNNVLAVTARSETYPYSEYIESKWLAKRIGARQLMIKTRELDIKNFRSNPVNRCYYCKKELFKKLDAIRKMYGMDYVLDGTNYDDLKDIRYGRKAAKELGVKSPLLEAEITKDDIRKFSKRLKLQTHNKPSFACLASRIPFGTKIDEETLGAVDRSEAFLKKLGIKQARIRAHKNIARIEIFPEDFAKILRNNEAVVKKLKRFGFTYVALDLIGYRTGSMHEAV